MVFAKKDKQKEVNRDVAQSDSEVKIDSFPALLVDKTELVANEHGVGCVADFRLAQLVSGRDWEQFAYLALEGWSFEVRLIPPKKEVGGVSHGG